MNNSQVIDFILEVVVIDRFHCTFENLSDICHGGDTD